MRHARGAIRRLRVRQHPRQKYLCPVGTPTEGSVAGSRPASPRSQGVNLVPEVPGNIEGTLDWGSRASSNNSLASAAGSGDGSRPLLGRDRNLPDAAGMLT